MFDPEVYQRRRDGLRQKLEGDRGLVLLPGNGESPVNYEDNAYPFRQDSTFLYYFGLDQPDLAAVLDLDSGAATLFGDDPTVEQIVWTGEVPRLADRGAAVGVSDIKPRGALGDVVSAATSAGRNVHYLPPYRADIILLLARLLNMAPDQVRDRTSIELVRAVVDQRARKGPEEIAEMESAVEVSVAMHQAALELAAPGVTELQIAAEVERIAREAGGRLAYPAIATINGQTLHNHSYHSNLSDGDVFLLDTGAETATGYAADLTSSFPASPRFTDRQRAVYQVLLDAYDAAVAAIAPGVRYRDVHLECSRVIFDGLSGLGLTRGDTDEAVAAGAHALFFPHGLGHMIGLDVHDMENLGEDLVGYAGEQRSTQFGLRSLRLARALESGFTLTVEPGIYFIPQLIDDWKGRGHCAEFIDYDELQHWRDFGGMRNEEDFLVTDDGARRLGPRKPQTIQELERG